MHLRPDGHGSGHLRCPHLHAASRHAQGLCMLDFNRKMHARPQGKGICGCARMCAKIQADHSPCENSHAPRAQQAHIASEAAAAAAENKSLPNGSASNSCWKERTSENCTRQATQCNRQRHSSLVASTPALIRLQTATDCTCWIEVRAAANE